MRPCKWCADGWRLIDGEHWVVRGLGNIAIKPCASPATATLDDRSLDDDGVETLPDDKASLPQPSAEGE